LTLGKLLDSYNWVSSWRQDEVNWCHCGRIKISRVQDLEEVGS
jgi:hypothetical protein